MTIKAKFAGTCKTCGRKISVGDEIEWTKGHAARHVDCETRKSNPVNAETNGTEIYSVDNFEYAAEAGWVFQDNGRWLTVLSSSGFYTEDPLSFGKMDGADGYIYNWKCRAATPGEIAIADGDQKAAKDKADTERAARIAKNQAEKAEHEAKREAFFAERDKLISAHGLVETESVPTLQGSVEEKAITPPGKGFSWTVFLRVVSDTEGRVLCVSQSNEETGTLYWATPEIAEKGNAVKRVCQYWREGTYHLKDYPGPGIARDELSDSELTEVERLETLKYDACVQSQVSGSHALNPYNKSTSKSLEPLSVTIEGDKVVYLVTKTDEIVWLRELSRRQELLKSGYSGWSATYTDPKRGTYKTHAPLEFEIRSK